MKIGERKKTMAEQPQEKIQYNWKHDTTAPSWAPHVTTDFMNQRAEEKRAAPAAPSSPMRHYYSRDILDAGMDTAMQDLTVLEQDMNQKKKNMDAVYSMTGGAESAFTAGVRGAYDEAKKAYDSAVPGFLQKAQEYDRQISDWKKNIRAEEEIKKDQDQVEYQIKQQRQKIVFGGDAPELEALQQKQRLLQEELEWRRYYQYEDLPEAEDFEKYSKPNLSYVDPKDMLTYSTVNAGKYLQEKAGLQMGQYVAPGDAQKLLGIVTGYDAPVDLDQLTDRQKGIYNYVYAKKGREAAREYLDYLASELNAKGRRQEEEERRAFAAAHPWISTAQTVARSPFKGLAFVGQTADFMADNEIDPNAWYNRGIVGDKAAAAEVSRLAEKNWGPAGSWLYNQGISMGNFIMNNAVTGGNRNLTLAIMGSGAAADTVIDALDRGLDSGQAYTIGAIAGAAEILTERISIDALLDPQLLKDGTLSYIVKNILSEGSEEGMSDIINFVADALIAGDESEFNTAIREYEKAGWRTPGEALGKAVGDQVMQLGLDVLGGGLSGGIMSSVGAAKVNYDLTQTGYRNSWDWDWQKRQERTKALMDTGKEIKDETLNKITENLQKKLDSGKQLSAKDIGQIHTALAQAVATQMEEERKKNTQPNSFAQEIQNQIQGKFQEKSMQEIQDSDKNTVTLDNGLVVSKELADQAKRLSKATGREITIIDDSGDGAYIENGHYDGNKIYVNTRSENPMGQIVGHELTHSIQGTEAYNTVATMVKSELGDQLESARQEIAERYAAAGVELQNPEDIDYEVVAEWVEKHMLTSEKEIQTMVREKPSLGQRILSAIDGMLEKLGNKNAKERNYLRKIRANYARALRESKRPRAQTAEQAVGAVRNNQTVAEEEVKTTAAENATAKESLQVDEQTPARKTAGSEISEERQKRKTQANETREMFGAMLEAGEISQEEYDSAMDAIDQAEEEGSTAPQYSISAVSKKDSEGRDLTPQQQEFFKDSKVRDEKGNLMPMYHGTDDPNFTVFDPRFSDDKRSLFFSADPAVADSYGFMNGVGEIDPYKITSAADYNAKMEKEGSAKRVVKFDKSYRQVLLNEVATKNEDKISKKTNEVKEKLEKLKQSTNKHLKSASAEVERVLGGVWFKKEDSQEALRKAFKEAKRGDAFYPFDDRMILNTVEEDMNEIQRLSYGVNFRVKADGSYIALDENGKPVTSEIGWLKNGSQAEMVELSSGEKAERIRGNRYKVYLNIKNPLMVDASKSAKPGMKSGYWNDVMLPNGERTNTRGAAEYAEKNGFDGVIFKNMIDYGMYAFDEDDMKGSTIAVAFNPDQIKSAYNKNPTSDPDIRYSIGWNPEGSVAASTPDGSRFERDELIGRLNYAEMKGTINKDMVLQETEKINGLSDEEIQNYMLPDSVRKTLAEDEKEDWNKFQKAAKEKAAKKEAQKAEAEAKEQQTAETPIVRDHMTQKAQTNLRGTENKLKKDILKVLGLDKFGDPEAMSDLVKEISDEYLQTGKISEEKMDLLFDKAYAEGIILDKEMYNQYKPVKDYIRTTAVTISEQDKADIADFKDWRASTFGRMRIVNQGGLPVDVAYDELHDMAPELFPESITHPADQLNRMYEVTDQIRVIEKNLQDYEGDDAEFARAAAKNGFSEVIHKYLPKIRAARRVAQEKIAAENKQQELLPKDTTEAIALMEDMKKARRNAERAIGRNLLTARDEQKVGMLLTGQILPEDLSYQTDNVEGILEVYEAKKEYEALAKRVKAWKKQIHQEMRDTADTYLEDSLKWKDKKNGFAYARETMRRNIYDIVPDKETADAILKEYFEPVQQAEAAATRFKDEYRQRVKDMDLSRKVDKESGNLVSEAHAVQLYGEASDNIQYLKLMKGVYKARDGKTLEEWEDVLNNLWAENPGLDKSRIENAVKQFRQIYEELFQKMNRVRVENGYEPINHRRGYFPHFQADSEENLMAAFGRALGINTAVDVLPTSINGLTHSFKPGITWFSNAQERLGFDTAYDAVQGFDKYIEGVASVIYQTRNIQKLRSLAQQIRYRSTTQGIRERVDQINGDPSLSEDMKKLAIDDVYKNGQFALSNFVDELEEYTNLLANKKSRLDRTVEALMGRRIYSFMKAWESRVGANMVAANISSAMTNFIPLTQAWSRIPSRHLLKGMWDTLSNAKQRDGLMSMSDFYTNRKGSDPLVETKLQQISKVLGMPMELIDGFVTESIVRGAYEMNLEKGMSEAEAMHQADLFAADVMADRSKGSMPTLFESRNPLIKSVTQFQLEVNNQFSEIFKDLPRYGRDKGMKMLAVALLKYFLGAWIYNQFFEKAFGRKPAIDPLSMLNDVSGDLTGYKLPNVVDLMTGNGDFKVERKGLGEAGRNLATEAVGQLPFSAGLALMGVPVEGGRLPAAAAIPSLPKLWKAATEEGWSPEKRWKEARDEIGKLAYIVPPFAGGQALKTYKGLRAYFKGGSYNVDAEGNDLLQYPIYKDDPAIAWTNFIMAGIMGKSATSEAQKWVDSGFKGFSAKQTAMYQDLMDNGVKDKRAFEFVKGLTGIEKTETQSKKMLQRKFINDSSLPEEAKAIAFYGAVASEEERKMMDRLMEGGASGWEVADTFMKIQDAGSEGEGASLRKKEYILDSKLTPEEKMEIYSEKFIAEDSEKPADIDAFRQVGLDFDDYLNAEIQKTKVYDRLGEDDDKALEYAHWIQKQNMTKRQKEIVQSVFGSKNEKYMKILNTGISEDAAYKLTKELNAVHGSRRQDDQKRYNLVLKARLSDNDKMRVFSEIMPEATYIKMDEAYNLGVSPETYLTFKEHIFDYDADGSGGISNKELEAAIDGLEDGDFMAALGFTRISNKEKAVLWQMNTSSKPYKNPYDQRTGQIVYDRVKERKNIRKDS